MVDLILGTRGKSPTKFERTLERTVVFEVPPHGYVLIGSLHLIIHRRLPIFKSAMTEAFINDVASRVIRPLLSPGFLHFLATDSYSPFLGFYLSCLH